MGLTTNHWNGVQPSAYFHYSRSTLGRGPCAIHRAVLLCEGGVLRVEDVSLLSVAPSAGDGELPPAERRTGDAAEGLDEKQQIVEALQATNWMIYGVHGAAALLGMHPEKLRYRMQKYGLRRPKK